MITKCEKTDNKIKTSTREIYPEKKKKSNGIPKLKDMIPDIVNEPESKSGKNTR